MNNKIETIMKWVDVTGQTFLIVACAISLAGYEFSVLGMVMALPFLGAWQMISSLVSLVRRTYTWLWILKGIHLLVASVYLIILNFFWAEWMLKLQFVTIPPIALAMYYYVLSWQDCLSRQQRLGKFLPHLGF